MKKHYIVEDQITVVYIVGFFLFMMIISGACLTRPRHRYHLSKALLHLKNYLIEMDEDGIPLSIQAHYLSSALRELGLLTGKITLSSIHDKIFSDFCIGK